jgi:hypothetical protein
MWYPPKFGMQQYWHNVHKIASVFINPTFNGFDHPTIFYQLAFAVLFFARVNLSLFSQNCQYLKEYFGENIFKIIKKNQIKENIIIES